MTFAIALWVTRRVSRTWDDQAEQLRGGHKRLTDAKEAVGSLGDRVAPAAGTYLSTWLTEVSSLADAAQGRSESLAELTQAVVDIDAAAADDLRSTLPWSARDAVRPTDITYPVLASVPPFFPYGDPR